MMELTNRMSDKIGWNEKVFDKDITTKWKSEALATPDTDISEKMVDWAGTSCISPSDSAYYPHLTAGSVSPSLNIKHDRVRRAKKRASACYIPTGKCSGS